MPIDLLTACQLAAALGVSADRVRYAAKKHRIEPYAVAAGTMMWKPQQVPEIADAVAAVAATAGGRPPKDRNPAAGLGAAIAAKFGNNPFEGIDIARGLRDRLSQLQTPAGEEGIDE